MKTKPIIWQRSTEKYANSCIGRIEHIKIGEVFWDSCCGQTETKKYKAHFNLPGYKQSPVNFDTEEQGKIWIEHLFLKFINKIINLDNIN